MKKLMIILMMLSMVACNSLDINLGGVSNKVVVIKTVNQSDSEGASAENSGSKIEDSIKDLEQTGGEIAIPEKVVK